MSGDERKNDAGVIVTVSDGEAEVLEETLPPMEDAAAEQKRIEVLGYNHRRRTEEERLEDERRRRARWHRGPARWENRVRWRLRSDRKIRWFCICFTCLATGVVSMVGLWSLGEVVAALAVTGTIMLLGVGVCIAAEIVVWCPPALEWLLYNAGFITPYTPLEDGGEEYEQLYDVETGDEQLMTFASPDIPADDFDEMGKPLYGAHALRENQPIEKAKRAATTVLRTFQSAWAPHPPAPYSEADDVDDDDAEYEAELGELAEDLQLRDSDTAIPQVAEVPEAGDTEPSEDLMKTG